MTRKEIEKFSAVEPSYFKTEREERWYEIGCIDGLTAADEEPNLASLWHDASEFPNKALPIIVEIDDDIEHSYEVISIDETDENFWEYLVSDRDITIWAYIKDLLPKGGIK